MGWNPIMACTKADSGVEEMVEMFLTFLETRLEYDQLSVLFDSTNMSDDTIFTLMMRNNELLEPSRRILYSILRR